MRKLSALYEILVYIEDRGSAQALEIQKWGSAVSRGVLGKMEAMGLLKRSKSTTGTQEYRLSTQGYKFLNSVLDVLHKGVVHWDGKWRFVWFSISEKDRPKRDKFRRFLESSGFRPILNSVWVTPLDESEKILSYARSIGVEKNIIHLVASSIAGLNQQDILNAWDFETYKKEYEEFIAQSNEVLTSKQIERFDLKKLIFQYAILLNNEPKLPIELMPNDWLSLRAQMQYKKIRRLIS